VIHDGSLIIAFQYTAVVDVVDSWKEPGPPFELKPPIVGEIDSPPEPSWVTVNTRAAKP
jgi:hypothetical protein